MESGSRFFRRDLVNQYQERQRPARRQFHQQSGRELPVNNRARRSICCR